MKEKPPCEQCQEIHELKDEEPPCAVCLPELMPENHEVARVYLLGQNQVITTMGQVIDLDISAIKTIMDIYKVEDQRTCLERVMKLFHYFQEEEGTVTLKK